MNLLLDTHAVLWWLDENDRLPERVRSKIASANSVNVSAVTAYEIAIKARTGKLKVPQVFIDDFDGVMESQGFQILGISAKHASFAGFLPLTHRDPFDRLLVAQAKLEELTLISGDADINVFKVATYW